MLCHECILRAICESKNQLDRISHCSIIQKYIMQKSFYRRHNVLLIPKYIVISTEMLKLDIQVLTNKNKKLIILNRVLLCENTGRRFAINTYKPIVRHSRTRTIFNLQQELYKESFKNE